MLKMIVSFIIAKIVLVIIGIVVALFLLNALLGCSAQAPAPAATAMVTSAATQPRAAQAGPTDVPAPTDTPTPTATSTPVKGIRGASGQPTLGSLAGSVPTRVASSPTPQPTAKATLRPGETRQPEGQKIEVPNPLGGDPFSIPIPGGYTPMPTVNVNIQLPGGATPTATPKPCTNFAGWGCPSPKSDQPAPKPPASAGDNQEGGGFPWLQILIGLVVVVLLIAGIAWVLFRTGILRIEQQPPP
ncbi:MAG: hypothetical protein UV05_C0011G0030 [candidate division CPR1 bacterium GW2011_GWA2_42_17]|uniref:Uncharacterized protein n=1 Tax=candidate division CPR1 bacterium GW2011_GWA2_42_17 TaxID=1618341 RepID=A0A0G0Z634_9BACT|nr:MAG: hypothetical protein UV05_C0011G0030 [candidate division CPR1 bacterium GW2011_GWA2_42_17]